MKRNGYILNNINYFMTQKDIELFFDILRSKLKNIAIVDYNPSKDCKIKKINKIEFVNNNPIPITIINTDIMSMDEYTSLIAKRGEYYHFPMVGKGMIQGILAEYSEYHKECLASSYFSSSCKESDFESLKYSKQVFNILSANKQTVFRKINGTSEFNKNAEKKYFSWSDAAKIFNGINGRYLSLGYSIFAISKNVDK
jgi:hypothetical protein